MIYEWEAKKARANLRKHHVSFEDASTVFLDPLALTFPDPDHSDDEEREIRIGMRSAGNMKKVAKKKLIDDLRPEYDLRQLKGGVRGRYFRQATAGSNVVLIDPDLADVFPDADSVNRALRLLVQTAEAVVSPTRRRSGARR